MILMHRYLLTSNVICELTFETLSTISGKMQVHCLIHTCLNALPEDSRDLFCISLYYVAYIKNGQLSATINS